MPCAACSCRPRSWWSFCSCLWRRLFLGGRANKSIESRLEVSFVQILLSSSFSLHLHLPFFFNPSTHPLNHQANDQSISPSNPAPYIFQNDCLKSSNKSSSSHFSTRSNSCQCPSSSIPVDCTERCQQGDTRINGWEGFLEWFRRWLDRRSCRVFGRFYSEFNWPSHC